MSKYERTAFIFWIGWFSGSGFSIFILGLTLDKYDFLIASAICFLFALLYILTLRHYTQRRYSVSAIKSNKEK